MHRVMEATLPVERSRMPSGRLMPHPKALLARHTTSASPDMLAPFVLLPPLFAGREAGSQASCPLLRTRTSSTASGDFS